MPPADAASNGRVFPETAFPPTFIIRWPCGRREVSEAAACASLVMTAWVWLRVIAGFGSSSNWLWRKRRERAGSGCERMRGPRRAAVGGRGNGDASFPMAERKKERKAHSEIRKVEFYYYFFCSHHKNPYVARRKRRRKEESFQLFVFLHHKKPSEGRKEGTNEASGYRCFFSSTHHALNETHFVAVKEGKKETSFLFFPSVPLTPTRTSW